MIPLRGEVETKTFPIATIFLIAVNVIIFFYQRANYNYEIIRDVFSLAPIKIFYMHEKKFYFTLISYMFLHTGYLHIFSNMLFLWVFGNSVEDIVGHMGFVYFYTICGIGAGLIHAAVNPSSGIPTVGASGAIAGVLAAYMVLYPTSRIVTLVPIFIFWQVIKIPAYIFIGLWFLFQFFYGFSSLSPESNIAGIAWFAHIGGFVVGIFLLPIFLMIKRIASQN